jgi:hypothetical protein
MAPNATIRNGDYPTRERGSLEVTVIFSGLSDVAKVREYYGRSVELIPEFKRRKEEMEVKLKSMQSVGDDIPSLLSQ